MISLRCALRWRTILVTTARLHTAGRIFCSFFTSPRLSHASHQPQGEWLALHTYHHIHPIRFWHTTYSTISVMWQPVYDNLLPRPTDQLRGYHAAILHLQNRILCYDTSLARFYCLRYVIVVPCYAHFLFWYVLICQLRPITNFPTLPQPHCCVYGLIRCLAVPHV